MVSAVGHAVEEGVAEAAAVGEEAAAGAGRGLACADRNLIPPVEIVPFVDDATLPEELLATAGAIIPVLLPNSAFAHFAVE